MPRENESDRLRINRNTLKRREQELKERNPWGSKLLFEELFKDTPTDGSQLFLYQKVQHSGGAYYIPRRVDIGDVLSFDLSILDEGNAFTSYLPSQMFDEMDAAEVYSSDDICEEGDADTTYNLTNPFG